MNPTNATAPRKAPRPRSKPLKLYVPPPPRPVPPIAILHAGVPVMSVPLTGDLGTGRRMMLDLLTWERVCLILGDQWGVRQPRGTDGPLYVVSYRKQARALAGHRDGSAPVMCLARWLIRAGEDDVVSYNDGDSLNLTRRNLSLENRGEHWARSRSR